MGATQITGLVCRGDGVEWTTLRRRAGSVETLRQGGAPLAAPAPDAPAGEAARALRAACGAVHGPVSLALPSERTLMRVLDLPSADPAELRGMVELQVDQFSPFPVEQLVVGLEILGARGGRSHVLAVAAPREAIDAAAAQVRDAGLRLLRIDLALLGWWELLRAADGAGPGRRLHVVAGPSSFDFLLVDDGLPVLCRAPGRTAGAGAPEAAAELLEEIRFTLTSVEAERGAAAATEVVVWDGAGGVPLPPEAGGVPLRRRALSGLPPLSEGIARRALAAGAGTADLAPGEWAQQRRDRGALRRFWAATFVFLGLWAAGVLGFWAALQWEHRRVASDRAAVEELEKPAEEARRLHARLRALEEYADRRRSALEALRAASEGLPDGVELLSFSYRRGKTLALRGEAAEANSVYDYVTALQQSGLFAEVKPEGIVTKAGAGGALVSDFKINATLPERAP